MIIIICFKNMHNKHFHKLCFLKLLKFKFARPSLGPNGEPQKPFDSTFCLTL